MIVRARQSNGQSKFQMELSTTRAIERAICQQRETL